MRFRIGAVAIVRNSTGHILLCKMPKNRGVYPGQWAIPGGGLEPGEMMEATLKRELLEEVGLDVHDIEPFWFQDDTKTKIHADGHSEELYMIHLIFDCQAEANEVKINDEFEQYAWVSVDKLREYDLNSATRKTFAKKGWL